VKKQKRTKKWRPEKSKSVGTDAGGEGGTSGNWGGDATQGGDRQGPPTVPPQSPREWPIV